MTGRRPKRPGTPEEEIDKFIALLASLEDPERRCRALQWYVRFLRRAKPKGRGRLANPTTYRAQMLDDWDVFDAVEATRKKYRLTSNEAACDQLAEDRGLKGKDPGSGLLKAYYRHLEFFVR